jgi:hypothetical protein
VLPSKPSARVSIWGLETGALLAVARSSCLSASFVLKSRNTLPVSPVVFLWLLWRPRENPRCFASG